LITTKESPMIFRILIVLALLPIASPASAGSIDHFAEQLKAFGLFAEQQLESEGNPALSVAVDFGDTIWTAAYGWADIENQTPAKPLSAYRLASVTKPMTAVAILNLAEEGKIDLDAEIQTYVPYFPRKEYPVTIRQLLSHLGGISHYKNYDREGHIKEPMDTREAIAIFEDFALIAEPGTQFNYSSYGFNLVGAAIETASGMSYGEYLSKAVWGPMGMSNTRMDDPRDLIPNRVRGYARVDGKLMNSEYVDISSRFAAGGTRSTVVDMVKFVRGLEAGLVLESESMQLLWRKAVTADGMFISYGLGWDVDPLNGHYRVLHGGSQPETRTRLTHYPPKNITIAMATNLEGTSLAFFEAYLWWLLFDEGYNQRAYLPDEREGLVYDAIRSVFQYGLASYERADAKPHMTDREIDGAFEYFNNSVKLSTYGRDPEACKKIVREGAHPAGNQRFVALGEYMAARLYERDSTSIARYHRLGELAFFADYINLSRVAGSEGRKFQSEFEGLVDLWNSSWQRLWTREMRGLVIDATMNLDATEAMLRSSFAGATIIPAYADKITSAATQAFLSGNAQGGLRIAKLGADLYPEHESTVGLYGVVLVGAGQPQLGRELILKAAGRNPDGYVGVGNLLQVSRFFAAGGNPLGAQALLEIGAELHPESEEIKAALGEIRAVGNPEPAPAPAQP
jgi:CubicO group peptidase (beta-lactamase class C family)